MRCKLGTLVSVAVVGSVLLAACSESSEPPPPIEVPAAGQLPEGHPPVEPQAGQAAPADGPLGVVLETMDSGGYTYARLEIDGGEMWAAGPVTPLAVGDTVALAGAMGMQNFRSNTLDRTFEQILFVAGFVSAGAPGAGGGAGAPVPRETFAGNTGLVTETMNSGGYTYVLVEIEGQTLWIAGPQIEVEVGQSVGWMDGMFMQDFTSSTLNRTFDAIFFANSLAVVN